MLFKYFICILVISTHLHCNDDIKFKAQSLTIHLPDLIIASGNTYFKNSDIDITSNEFTYNTKTNIGRFKSDVIAHYKNSKFSGDYFNIDNEKKHIFGRGNISFKSPTLTANSNHLKIQDFEVLTLMDNVKIQQNGSQINADELIYNLMTDTIISNERIKLKISE